MNIKKLVFATNNQHKLEEARRIVDGRFEVVSLAEIGCHDDIPETADTLKGNALIKARWVHDRYGYDCFADDTGLMVDALDGAPGVYSARYAGEHCSPADNVAKLLHEMEGKDDRKAHFSTVMALIADGEEHVFEGSVHGSITHRPHGEGGFGYDPVFRADETGLCFAEMTPDAKNAISHRGRALRKLREFLGIIVAVIIMTAATFHADASNGQWRYHHTVDAAASRIIDTKKQTYLLAYKQRYEEGHVVAGTPYINIFMRDKEDGEIRNLDSQYRLSENVACCADYNFKDNYLLVAYDSGALDVVYDNGETSTIQGLKLADSDLSRRVLSISFDPDSGYAYLGTGFGFAVIDVKKGDVVSSRIYRKTVRAAIKYDGRIFVSTDESTYYGDERSFNLAELSDLGSLPGVSRFVRVGGDLYAIYGKSYSLAVARISKSGSGYKVDQITGHGVTGMETCDNGGLMIAERNRLRFLDADGKESAAYNLEEADKGMLASSFDRNSVWFFHPRKGISCRKVPAGTSSAWVTEVPDILPNASNAFICEFMALHPEYGMLVRNHGYNNNFTANLFLPDLLSAYKNMTWTPMSATYRSDNTHLTITAPNGLAIDPQNQDHVYGGSPLNGFMRLDLKNPDKSLHFTKPSDPYGGEGQPGVIIVVPDNNVPPEDWNAQCGFCNPVFDSSGNLWTAYRDPDKNKASGNKYAELWYWSPQDRAATTSASTYRAPKKISFDNMPNGLSFRLLGLGTGSNRNTVCFFSGGSRSPVTVLKHNGDPSVASERTSRTVSIFHDQDDKDIDLNYIYCWMEDPTSGLVWAGYNDGVFTFNPQSILAGSTEGRRIKVARNDGTNLADYLLDGTKVLAMDMDSRGRKWFGTLGAGLVCTSSDGRTIIESYTTDNSGLPDNQIYGLKFNPQTNSIMVSTGNGLCELFLSGDGGNGDGDEARAWPNPVRPDYFGAVTIDNLPDNVTVKIVDSAGNLIKDLGYSEGGTCTWDVTNIFHKRASAGVYFVIAANGPDAESYSKVSKIMVIN